MVPLWLLVGYTVIKNNEEEEEKKNKIGVFTDRLFPSGHPSRS